MEENISIRDEIKRLREEVLEDKKIKEKKFKFPFGKKVGTSQKKKNFVTILLLSENGTYDFKKYQIENQTVLHEAIPRLATAGHVMFDKKGNPLIILPNWSVEPFSPLDHYEKTMISGSNTKGFKILMAQMELSKVENKTHVGGWVKWVVGLALAGIVIWAIVGGGGS